MGKMDKYNVTGMSCAACSARVEKAVSSVPGVSSCSVSLLTNSMGVEGNAKPEDIISAVENAGYGAALKGQDRSPAASASELEDKETPILKKRLIASVGFLIILMYISMGHTMFGAPLPGFFQGNHIAMGLAQLLLAGIVMVINQKFFISGFRGLVNRAPNMDTLVAMGSMTSFVWSVYELFTMTKDQLNGDSAAVMDHMHGLYFESAAMIVTLITVGKMLEAHSKGKTTNALRSLMELAPETACVIRDGKEITIPAQQLKTGDIFIVRPGENIPADGIVIEGNSAVNEASLTGESIPADKAAGDEVSAATVNQSGVIRCRALRVGEETALSKIIKMVSDAAATKAPAAKLADKVSGIFVPSVILIAVITIVIWLLAGQTVGYALARGISVLVISCPCALGLATPVAIMVGSGVGARNGILFKTAASLENTGKIQIAALDKTGTITAGEPSAVDIITAEGVSENELLTLAGSLERNSEHPLAKAVMKLVNEKNIQTVDAADFTALPGNGLRAVINGMTVRGGNLSYISEICTVDDAMKKQALDVSAKGRTPLFFACDNKLLGLISAADKIKEDSAEAVSDLKNMGIKVVMLTGDNENTANTVGGQAGVDKVIAGVLPDGKEQVIRTLSSQGKTAMVGDGINDAPALTRADTGIAIGAGTDVAIDAADIVLMKSSLSDVAAAVRLSRATLRNIKQNLFWAFFYNVIGIPLAAGAYIHLFGWELNPMFGAAAMSLSSFFVVTNALRLNFVDIHDRKHDKPAKNAVKAISLPGDSQGRKMTVKIKGMMCGHCENRVKAALEKLSQIDQADVNWQAGTAVITLNSDISSKELKKAIEDEDYKFVSVN